MLGQNISDNRLDSYSDHSISAYRDFQNTESYSITQPGSAESDEQEL